MRCLVTGGAGFIGSHLAEALLERGWEVIILDDLSTGRAQNLASLRGHPRAKFVQGSIVDEDLVDEHAAGCEHIYHLAAAVGVKLVFDHPVRTIETNVHGTESVLRAARKHGCGVLIASTSEVYGKDPRSRGGLFGERDDLMLGTSLRWGYAASKALDEYLARAYHREYDVPIVVVRFFNTVGPRQTGAYGMVLPRLVDQALAGRPLTIYGDGTQVRVFLWVGDAVAAVLRLMEHPEAVGQIVNIGGSEPTTIHDLAVAVKAQTGSDSPIAFVPYEEAYGPGFEDIRYRVPDTAKLRALLGFEPSKGLREIIAAVVQDRRRFLRRELAEVSDGGFA